MVLMISCLCVYEAYFEPYVLNAVSTNLDRRSMSSVMTDSGIVTAYGRGFHIQDASVSHNCEHCSHNGIPGLRESRYVGIRRCLKDNEYCYVFIFLETFDYEFVNCNQSKKKYVLSFT